MIKNKPMPAPDATRVREGAKRIARRVALVMPFVAFVLLCEVGAYFYLRLTTPYHNLKEFHEQRPVHEFDPYRIIRLNPRHRFGGVQHDAQGFRRSTEVSKQKPTDTIRIFLMGGSAAYGVEPPPPFPPFTVTNADTLDAHLERLLSERFPGIRVEVINAAVVGYRVHIHWIYLNQVLLGYDPDVVVFFDGHNDHYHASDAFDQFDYDNLDLDALNEPSLLNALNQFVRVAARHSYAVAGMESRLRRILDASLTPKRLQEAWSDHMDQLDSGLLDLYRRTAHRTWASIVRQNCRLLQDRGVRAVVTLQPELLLAQRKVLTPSEEHLRDIERNLRPPGHEKYLNFIKPTTVELLQEAIAGTGATFADLTDPFTGITEQAYIDYCHLSGAGFAAVARQLLPIMTPIVEEVAARRGLLTSGSERRHSEPSPPIAEP
jgi:hypothetical protein